MCLPGYFPKTFSSHSIAIGRHVNNYAFGADSRYNSSNEINVMRVETLKYISILGALLFAATSVQAQNSHMEISQKNPFFVITTSDWVKNRTKPFTRDELVLMGNKFIELWGGRYRRNLAKRMISSNDFDESILTAFVGGIYMTHPADNEKSLRRLTNELKVGDKISAYLLGLIMYVTGSEMLESRQPVDRSDPNTVGLLYAARHFGFPRAAAIINSRFYLLSDNFGKSPFNDLRNLFASPC